MDNPTKTLRDFDDFLAREGLWFEAVVIGGAALHVLNIVGRATDDVDVLAPAVPPEIATAAARFAALPETEPRLATWLNSKSYDFVGIPGCLPEGWQERVRPLLYGKALRLDTLGRQDLLCTKLVAAVDRGDDLDDCVALAPTAEELAAAWPFVEQYEGNEEVRRVFWVPTARKVFAKLEERLGRHHQRGKGRKRGR